MYTFKNWCELPTEIGIFRMYDTGSENVKLISYGDINELDEVPLVRIHSSCTASEVFDALDCDCSDQLRESMRLIFREKGGLIIHLHQEGRGYGLSKKIMAVRLMQKRGFDTVEAFHALDLKPDIREYNRATDILLKLGIDNVRLITNNPLKVEYVESKGITVVESIKTYTNVRKENFDYLCSKNERLNHRIPLAGDSEKIFFHNINRPYGYLSNFSNHPIYCKGKIWNTVEHFYQAQKFKEPELKEEIRLAPTPMKAKMIAHANKELMMENWDELKNKVMYDGLYAKFTQHPDIQKKLTETDDKILCEHTSTDSYWGDGGDGTGKNILGELLMDIREKLSDL